jgi:hypothetical protein
MKHPIVMWSLVSLCTLAAHAQAAELQPGYVGVNVNDSGAYLGANVSLIQSKAALYFSNGQADPTVLPTLKPRSISQAVGVFNLMNLSISAPTATLVEQSGTVGSLSKVMRTVVGLQSSVDQMSVDTSRGAAEVQSLRLNGGLNLAGTYLEGVSGGGKLSIGGLSVDTSEAGRVKVSAQLAGAAITNGATSELDGPQYGAQNVFNGVIWESTQASGPSSLPLYEILAATDLNDTSWLQQRGYTVVGEDMQVIGGTARKVLTLQSTQVFNGLNISDGALSSLRASLGLANYETGWAATEAINASGGWGVMNVTSTFRVYNNCLECHLQPPIPLPSVPGVPEPSTWALMLLGLAGVAWRVKRTH